MDTDIIGTAVTAFFDADVQPGDLISHEWLDEHLALIQPSLAATEVEGRDVWRRFELTRLRRMDEFRTRLLHEHRIALDSIPGRGYRRVPPREQAALAAAAAERRIAREITKASDLAAHTDVTRLTDAEQRNHIEASMHIARLAEFREHSRKAVFPMPAGGPEANAAAFLEATSTDVETENESINPVSGEGRAL